MSDARLSRLEIATGKLTPQRAMVFCGVPDCPTAEGWSLTGRITGPFSRLGSTLPAEFDVRDLGAGVSVLAQAAVLEPVYWSPDMPAHYRIELELRQHGSLVEARSLKYGIRWLESRGGAFAWNNRRTILRGCVLSQEAFALTLAGPLPGDDLTYCLADPEFEHCDLAMHAGAPLLAEWTPQSGSLAAALNEWTFSPALLAAIIPADEQLDRGALPPRPTLFLAADVRGQRQLVIPKWADAVALRDDQLAELIQTTPADDRPILIFAQRDHDGHPQSIRAACDRLRAELAPTRQCAGYFLL